ncbi:MAG: N-acetylmuramoyl-L-alanine amidase family protein [Clostridium beijerinckii]|jgi:glucan-binding YG repeat protein|nr:N-acetylmuramoyl-L-alanine amidase family protein [Clostridium beijerinckii]MCI1577519.1 N-acetylmuramoyl-L-alanine amidase family protein [Clostridium beijerinckii]MCI1585618.1 N-acetylmuramoyl-L-alanine amidase family protein [Clostridium beijerinckii]MCI1621192.1 N-acetylmuramoyl-L-alanine amidase family protein [Clostridium beijerinckii]
MIKRMTKATSLLVAAAAIISIVPASAATATTNLETKEGTIEKAIAFDGGKYLYEGYRTDDDQSGLYYNDGDKDKLIEDINVSSMDKYGDKYASVKDGNDEYLIDLSTGKEVDDTVSDNTDYVKTRLKTTLSKTDRYSTISAFGNNDIQEIKSNEFGETWYTYEATTSGSAKLHGYVNNSGKYIDTDVTANIYVNNGTKTIKVEKFDEADSGNNIVVSIDRTAGVKEIGQDKDYIYRLVTVNITGAVEKTGATYIQKISKAQGEQEGKAYLPKDVTSYEVTSAYKSEDADNADGAIKAADTSFRVVNGVVYAIKNDGEKVTVNTVKLKKDKATLDTAIVAANKDTKFDVYLAEKDIKEDQDIASKEAVSVDADGNIWALNNGKIYKFDGSDFQVVYTVDRSFDTLEVYNANNLIAWKDGEDGYATVSKATTTPVDPTPVTNKGWVNTASGWTFYNTDGTQVKGQWVQDGGVWYYIKADGVMATGWTKDGSTWYYLQSSGAMKTGWLNDNGTWYYLNGSGAMATGWLNDNGTWYYLNGSGAMLANTTVDGYKLGASGAWVK